jgi:hypothetical protein
MRKVSQETALFHVPYGSQLFGTATPQSDFDYKVVCLPPLDVLMLNRQVKNRVSKPEGKLDSDRMKAGEEESEFIPLQNFFDDFFNGQTYAIEIAMAVLSNQFTALEYEYGSLAVEADALFIGTWMQELVDKYLTKNVQKMVGYAISQSQAYGLKTERYNAYLAVHEKIRLHFFNQEQLLNSTRLDEAPELLEEISKFQYVTRCVIDSGERSEAGIEISGKKFYLSTKWNTLMKSIMGTIESYGTRVKEHTGEPTDWKALSHAIRIVEQIIELTTTGKIEFPRPTAKFLLEVKRGHVPLNEARDYLTKHFNMIDEAVEKSVLREKTPELEEEFTAFKLKILRTYYGV